MSTVVANGHAAETPAKGSRKRSPAPATTAPVVAVAPAAPAAPAPRTRKAKSVEAAPVPVAAPVAAEPEKKNRSRKSAAQPPAVAAPAAQVATPVAAPVEKKTRTKSKPNETAAPVAAATAETKTGGRSRRAKGTANDQKQPDETKGEQKVAKQPRVPKNHANAFTVDGVVTAMSRVRDELDNVINARHEEVVAAIQKAYNRPKPVAGPNKANQPAQPQGQPVPIANLPADIRQFINEAEEQYKQRLTEKYERHIIKRLRDKDKKKYETYMESRKKAMDAAEENKTPFNLHEFNEKIIPKFYSEEKDFVQKDILTIGYVHPQTGQVRCPDEWTRAIAVVNKTRIHFAKSTKVILSSFLDNIPRQLITNGITNILTANRSQVKLEFCLNQTAGFEKRLTLLPFLQTLSTYNLVARWVHECYEINQFNAAQKDKATRRELPPCPEIPHSTTFKQSVGNIFNSVRTDMINREADEEKKKQLQTLKFSEDTRFFCAGLIYEAITRIARALGRRITQEEKKTIRPDSMLNIIMEMMDLIGISDADVLMADVNARWQLFEKVTAERKVEKAKQNNNAQKVAENGDLTYEDQ